MKIAGVSLNDRVYAIEIDHLATEPARFELRTPWKIADVQGAKVETSAPYSYSLEIQAAPGNGLRAYHRTKVLVTFAAVD